ncbi:MULTISPECIES: hypothetical protein [Cyanophyceae]|uniref:hypothetical protein n=1 Tax=Cyanophyceae TaxID=3028117 RepID=UPI001685B348|nr:hypothetical protein [Trichocoleus sp. FACHB-40]MBD2005590.1 hypothetical protein [Trichocoleus sp. FACHB-40]
MTEITDSSSGNNFVLGLEDNAMDSLEHSVEHLCAAERDTDLKYTVLHIFHATELFLKARLAKDGLEQIYKNKKVEPDGYTVDFKNIIKRLHQIGVCLSEQDKSDLEFLRKVRNSIEHYEFAGDYEQIENYVGRAMRFLKIFLYKELGLDLQNELTERTYEALLNAFGSYAERMAEHNISLHPKDYGVEHDLLLCEQCHKEAVAFPDPTSKDRTVHCFRCEVRYFVKFCLRCECLILSLIEPGETTAQDFGDDFNEDEEGWFCDRCIKEIAERDY